MRPRAKLIAAVMGGAIAGLALANSHADVPAQRPPCGSYPNTVVANAHVKVFRIGFRRETRRLPSGFYACDVRSRRLHDLGKRSRDAGGVRLIRLAGRYVGYQYHLCYPYACINAIIRQNVRTGARRSFNEPPVGRSDAGDAPDLEVTTSGIVVWIRSVTTPTDRRFDVVRWDGRGVTVLDSGPLDQIEPESLAVSGRRAYWFAGGQARSAIVD